MMYSLSVGVLMLITISAQAQSLWQHERVIAQENSRLFISGASSENFVLAGSLGGESQVFITKNYGASWQSVLGVSDRVPFSLQGLVHPSSSLILIAADSEVTWGWNTFDTAGVLCRSTDGGESWQFISARSLVPNVPYSMVSSIAALDSNHIVLLTPGNGQYLHSSDGGLTWQGIPGPAKDAPVSQSVYTAPNTVLVMQLDSSYAYTSLYTFYRTTDLGSSWVRVMTTTHDISKLCFINSNVGFAAGFLSDASSHDASCTIDKTTNGGLTWFNLYTHRYPTAGGLYGISFLDSLNGIATGRYGLIIRTSDGGKTWTQDSSEFSEGATADLLQDVAYMTPKNAIAASLSGEALIYRPNGILSIPTITYPAYNESNGVPTSFDATWKSIPGATSYWIKLFVAGPNTIIALDSNIKTPTYHFANVPSSVTYTLQVQARNDSSRSNLAEVNFIVVSAAVSSAAENSLEQYLYVQTNPNPAFSKLHCRLSGLYSNPGAEFHAGLYDLLGRNVIDLTQLAIRGNNGVTSEFDVDIKGLPTGIYIVKYSLGSGSFSRAIVILE